MALVGLGVAVACAPLWGPPVLRHVPWFDIRRVEISGTRLLAPHQVLLAAGIQPGQSVWAGTGRWEEALRAHPVVADVRVTRRLPNTLRVRVEEKRAVAFVEDGVLTPVTASGERLPVDPTRAPADLPVVRSSGGDGAVRLLLAEAGRLSSVDPGLLAEVSEIRSQRGDSTTMVLTHRRAEIVLPVGADPARLAQLRAVLDDLERRLPEATPSTSATARVDLRFGGQVVVRLPSSV